MSSYRSTPSAGWWCSLPLLALAAAVAPAGGQGILMSEIRIDQPGGDLDEYFELSGPAGTSLDGMTYLVIGDGTGGSGVVEAVVDLAGQSINAAGFFVAAEDTFTLGTADFITSLNFENSDNVTHLLVQDFTGAAQDDLDVDDDGVLDIIPWSAVIDCVALIESVGSGDMVYCDTQVGPNGTFVPGHVYRCVPDGTWTIGIFDFDADDDGIPDGTDTPGGANLECPPPIGACCLPDGGCAEGVTPEECQADGGMYQGAGSTCNDVICPAPGACCVPDGLCLEPLLQVECEALGGTFQGEGTICADVICPLPGACCFADGSCQELPEDPCADAGGAFQGEGIDCADVVCEPVVVFLNEIRIDQPGSDIDEYFELTGEPGTGLGGLTYLVIGDGTGGSGVIEAVVDLAGQAIDAAGFFVAAEDTFTLGSADLVTNINFENSDNVTHLVVTSFSGSNGDDLDLDDDGILDTIPWTSIVDCVALIETPDSGEQVYCDTHVGPDGTFVPGHVYRCTPLGTWTIGLFDPADEDDTPGMANPGCPAIELSLDIKPGSCPNSFNRRSNGVLPVAILGTADFDVTQIDLSTMSIARADGVGGTAAPNFGPPGPSPSIDDVGTPLMGEPCECHEEHGDGWDDLVLHFRSSVVTEALELADLPAGDLVELCVSGTLLDGTSFIACDCIRLVPPGTPPGMVNLRAANVKGAWIDVTPLDSQLDGGGFDVFSRTFPLGTVMSASAAPEHQGRTFLGWRVDGRPVSKNQTLIVLVIGQSQAIEAIYDNGPDSGGLTEDGDAPRLPTENRPPSQQTPLVP